MLLRYTTNWTKRKKDVISRLPIKLSCSYFPYFGIINSIVSFSSYIRFFSNLHEIIYWTYNYMFQVDIQSGRRFWLIPAMFAQCKIIVLQMLLDYSAMVKLYDSKFLLDFLRRTLGKDGWCGGSIVSSSIFLTPNFGL